MLTGALRSYHDACPATYWRHVCSDVASDHAASQVAGNAGTPGQVA